jgi:hypothetical protein
VKGLLTIRTMKGSHETMLADRLDLTPPRTPVNRLNYGVACAACLRLGPQTQEPTTGRRYPLWDGSRSWGAALEPHHEPSAPGRGVINHGLVRPSLSARIAEM